MIFFFLSLAPGFATAPGGLVVSLPEQREDETGEKADELSEKLDKSRLQMFHKCSPAPLNSTACELTDRQNPQCRIIYFDVSRRALW